MKPDYIIVGMPGLPLSTVCYMQRLLRLDGKPIMRVEALQGISYDTKVYVFYGERISYHAYFHENKRFNEYLRRFKRVIRVGSDAVVIDGNPISHFDSSLVGVD